MNCRSILNIILAVAVLAPSGLGLNNGMVLRVDHHGQLAVEAHLAHLLSHTDWEDHQHPADHGPDGEHHDLHHLIGTTSDAYLATARSDQSASSRDLAAAQPGRLDLWFRATVETRPPVAASSTLRATDHRGGTARTELTSLRSIVLLV